MFYAELVDELREAGYERRPGSDEGEGRIIRGVTELWMRMK